MKLKCEKEDQSFQSSLEAIIDFDSTLQLFEKLRKSMQMKLMKLWVKDKKKKNESKSVETKISNTPT